MGGRLRIGIVGDFNPAFHSHHATNQALRRAGDQMGLDLAVEWLPTPDVERDPEQLAGCDGLWLAPGSPYESLEGALHAAEFARLRDWPFLGT